MLATHCDLARLINTKRDVNCCARIPAWLVHHDLYIQVESEIRMKLKTTYAVKYVPFKGLMMNTLQYITKSEDFEECFQLHIPRDDRFLHLSFFFFNVLNIYYFKPRLLSSSTFFRTPQFFQAYFTGSLMHLSRIWAPSILWPRIGFDTGPIQSSCNPVNDKLPGQLLSICRSYMDNLRFR